MPDYESSPPMGPQPIDWHVELKRHQSWLRTVVLARVGEPQAVPEVMQELAAAAVEHGHKLLDASKLAPWLYRLAVNTALQYRRKMGRQRKLTERFAQDTQPEEFDQGQPDPLNWLVAKEQRELVRLALKNIPRRDAEMLLLKYTENWSYQEIAEKLGLSTSAVESRFASRPPKDAFRPGSLGYDSRPYPEVKRYMTQKQLPSLVPLPLVGRG